MEDDIPTGENAPENAQEPQGEAEVVPTEETASETTEAAQEANTAVAVAEEPEVEPIPDPSEAELALVEIREATEIVTEKWATLRECQLETKSAREAEKEAESEWMAAVARQQSVIKGQNEKHPLFDRKWFQAKTKIESTAEAVKTEQLALEAKVAATPRDGWRAFRLEHTTIPSTTVKLLAESNYHTIGDIANLTASGLPLTDIKGVGQAKADKIEAGLARFWQDHPEYGDAEARKAPEPTETFEPADSFEPPAVAFDLESDSQRSGPDEDLGHEAPDPDEAEELQDEPEDDGEEEES